MKKGDIIEFGKYPQGADGSVLPIEWIVLDVNEKEALLISRHGLERKKYNETRTPITWEDCDLRKWLNNDFLKYAFSEEEIQRIKFSELKNKDTLLPRELLMGEVLIIGGNDTKDRIFCLSVDEIEQYFNSDDDRACNTTSHVYSSVHTEKGFNPISFCYYSREKGYCCTWWLRSPGWNQDSATCVGGGSINHMGYYVNHNSFVVRPALRITRNPSVFSKFLRYFYS